MSRAVRRIGNDLSETRLPLVITIQSQVAYGHVGNSAAAYPMRACGVEVIEVPTTLLSNHPHYPTTRGRLLEADLVAELLAGLADRGLQSGRRRSSPASWAGRRRHRRWRRSCAARRRRTRVSSMLAIP